MLPRKPLIWLYASNTGAYWYIILYGSVKSLSLKDIFLYLSWPLFECVKLYSLHRFEISIKILNSIPLCHYIPYLLNSDSLKHHLSTVFGLWCGQFIVCWLYQGWEWMGWSNVTELQTSKLIAKRNAIINEQLEGASLAGECTGMYMNSL